MSIGKTPIPGWNPAILHRSRTRPWWIAAIICWLLAAFVSEEIASAIGGLPQPDQTAWVAVFRVLPALPVILVATVTGVRAALHGGRMWSTASVPKLLFWVSLAVLLLAIPKPN